MKILKKIINKRINVNWFWKKSNIDEDFKFWCVILDISDVFFDKNDWLLSINGTYWRKLGGLRSSDIKHDDDNDKEWEEHVQERRGGGLGITGGGGGK